MLIYFFICDYVTTYCHICLTSSKRERRKIILLIALVYVLMMSKIARFI